MLHNLLIHNAIDAMDLTITTYEFENTQQILS